MHSEVFLNVCKRHLPRVNRERHPHLSRELQTVRIHVGDYDVPGPRMADNRGGHHADGARTGYQNVLAEDWKRERGVDGVPKWIENRSDLPRYCWMVSPDIGHRQRNVFREGAGPIHAHALCMGT